MSKVSTCLWFGKDAEMAVRFYVSLVPGSSLENVLRSPGAWPGGETGDVIMVTFTLGGQSFQALNGGAPATYGTAASISVECSDQAEVDRLWTALTADGGSEIMCGWLRDRWGVPWQIVPKFCRVSWPTQTRPSRAVSSPLCSTWLSWTLPLWSVWLQDDAGWGRSIRNACSGWT